MAGSDIVQGAGTGAAAGAPAGPWGAAIGAGVGAVSGYFAGRSRRKAEREQQALYHRATTNLGAKAVMRLQRKLLPQFREQIAAGIGPQFSQQVADNLARHGLTGTGIGETIRDASYAVPGIEAFNQSLDRALQIKQAQSAAMLGRASAAQSRTSPVAEALGAGANAYLLSSIYGGQNRRPPAPTETPNLFPTEQPSIFDLGGFYPGTH